MTPPPDDNGPPAPLDRRDGGILLGLAIAAFFVRCFNSSRIFVGGEVHFEEFDPFGHMRRVLLTIAHWPHVPQFDYYTNYPYGAKLAWGPGLDFLLATLSLALGLGQPLDADVERWCALAIPILGAAGVVCVYLLARELLPRGPSLLAAGIVAILPLHVFLGKLGRVDHHVTEPLFASLLWFFYLRAVQTGRWRDAWFAGLSQALGVLFWPGSILFSALLLAVLLGECALAAIARRPEPGWLAGGSRTLLASTLLTAAATPLSLWGREGAISYVAVSWFQPLALGAMALTLFLARQACARLRTGISPLAALGLLIGVTTVPAAALLALPAVRATLAAGIGYLTTSDPIIRTISESKPPYEGRDFIRFFWFLSYWSLLLPLALVALGCARRTWSAGSQGFRRRFVLILAILGTGLVLKQERHSATFILFMPLAVAMALNDVLVFLRAPRLRTVAAIAVFILVSAQPLWFFTGGRAYVILDPPVTPLIEPLTWMRYNTPPTSEGIRRGDVPAYGVMGYFGMGMYLNYVAQRPNVGTPIAQLPWHDEAIRDTFRFQFAEDESEALRILVRRRVRYVVVIPFYLFLKNGATILGLDPDRWLHDTRTYEEEKMPARFDFRLPYFSLVDTRLLLLDGSEATIRGTRIPALGNFRLVHEGRLPLNRGNFGDWSSELPPDLRYCKIFEVVPGARIAGRTLPHARVKLAVDIRAGPDRRFTYRSSAFADATGKFMATVPYPTEGMQGDSVHAEGPYRIQTIEGKTFSIPVPASAVLEGREVMARP